MNRFIITCIILFLLIMIGSCAGEREKQEQPAAYQNPTVAPYTILIHEDSTNADHYFKRAQALVNIQSDSLAILDFEKAIQLDSKKIQYQLTYGNFLFEIKKFRESAAQYEKVLAIDPTNENAILSIVQTYIQLNDPTNAQKYLDAPLKALPDHPVLNFLTAEIALISSDTTKALTIVDRLLADNPDMYAPTYLKGEILAAQNNEQSVTYFERAYDLDTMDLLPIEHIGDFYLARQDYANALKYYRKTVTHDNAYAYGFYKAAITYQKMDSFDKALSNFNHAIKTDLKYVDAYLGKASVFESMGQQDSATKYYQYALTFDNDNKEALTALERINR